MALKATSWFHPRISVVASCEPYRVMVEGLRYFVTGGLLLYLSKCSRACGSEILELEGGVCIALSFWEM